MNTIQSRIVRRSAAILLLTSVAVFMFFMAIIFDPPVETQVNAQLVPGFAKPTLVVLGGDGWCLPCKLWKEDVKDNRAMIGFFMANVFHKQRTGKHYIYVDLSEESKWSDPRLIRVIEKSVGHEIKGVPAFWVKGSNTITYGYTR